jgi:hypothetical protein
MNPTFSIFLAAALLLGSSSAEAARRGNGLSNLMLPPPFISTTQPPTNPVGGFSTSQSFGASPSPGSPTFDPNAALPSLNNSGSALSRVPGKTATGITEPSTGIDTTTSP